MSELLNSAGGRTVGLGRVTSELLDIRTVAELANVSTRTVKRLSDAGKMPAALKLGALRRWRRIDVLNWIANGCQPVTGGRGAA